MASVAKRKWTHKGASREAWVVRYKDAGGKHRSRQFDAKKAADAYKRKVENELEAGTHIAPAATVTLQQAVDEFLEAQELRVRRGERKPGGVLGASRALKYFTQDLGGIKMTDLTWRHIVDQVDRLRARRVFYNARNGDKKPGPLLATSTISGALGHLSGAMSWAARRGYIAKNLVADARREAGSMKQKPIQTFSVAEVKSILATIEQWYEVPEGREFDRRRKLAPREQTFMRAAVYLAAFCGLRKGEIFALRPDRINWTAGEIRIDASLDEMDNLGAPKTAHGLRTVPMPPVVAAALRAYEPFVKKDDRNLIFRTIHGTNQNTPNFYHKWGKLLNAAGIPKTERGNRNFHALRHFAGSAWLDAGASLPEVSRLLGHGGVEITARVYAHCIRDQSHRVAAIDRCAAALLPSPPLRITQEVRIAA